MRLLYICSSFLIAVSAFITSSVYVSGQESAWVKTGVTGRLVYVPDAQGDRILDFSTAGYQGRGVEAIPDDVPTVISISPVSGDDTANIQAAIDSVSALPVGPNGYRGAIELTAGEFDIHSQLNITSSGVVLRGAGQGQNGTILHGRSAGPEGTNQRPLIRVFGSGGLSNSGSRRNLIDKVVPVGATSFRVDVPSTFSPGDKVRVIRNTNSDWISDIGMDMIPPRQDGGTINQWTTSTINQRFDRVVTRVEGDRVFIDAPLPNAIEQHYGGGTIQKYNWSGAINNVGIESIRGVSEYDSDTDEDHAWEFISVGVNHVSSRAENVWIRDIHGKHFGDSLVVANPGSKWVTVANAVNEDPKSIITGGRRYSFDLSGELGFVTNAQADSGRHDFANNSTSPKGPNVFHNSIATNANSDSGPHQRWATGTLFDNVTVQGNQINARNRLNLGSGHGWSGANMVIWNSTANEFIVQNPPTAQNWLVGSTGNIIEDTQFGPQPSGNYDSHNIPVATGGSTSLYDAQLNDSRDIKIFRSVASSGNWTDAQQWDQNIAPLDSYQVSHRDYLVGDIDDYSYDGAGSVDDVYVDPIWHSDIVNSSALPITGLDDLTGNQNIAFTIQHVLDAGEQVIHGYMALGLKQGGGGLVNTDFLQLFDMAPQHKFSFSDLGWDTEISATDTFVGVLDLGLHLDELQSGSVNVQVNDDTGLDWAMYTATVATPLNDSASTSVFIDGGGTITVDTAISPVGQLNLGDSGTGTLLVANTGLVDIDGDFTQSVTGSLVIEIAGESNGQFGVINVLEDAVLGGTLEVLLDGGYTPELGDEFEILTASTVSGDFETINLPSLSTGYSWSVEILPNSVLLSVNQSADLNGDGFVDSLDLGILLGNWGLSTAPNMGELDGTPPIDGLDLGILLGAWDPPQANNSIAVPEATAATISIELIVLSFAFYRRTLWPGQ